MTYAIFDKALVDLDKVNVKGQSLFLGKTGELLDSVAPYLCHIDFSSEEFYIFISNPSHERWGIIIQTELNFKDLHHHLRKFLYVKTEDAQKLYFRFYDPSILPTFLRTSTQNQLFEFFGQVGCFICCDENNDMHSFRFSDSNLFEDTMSFEEFQKLNFNVLE